MGNLSCRFSRLESGQRKIHGEHTVCYLALKLRAGWGISSNAGINPYTTLGSLGTSFYNFGQGTTIGTNYVNGYTINTSPNPDLTWEKTEGLNIGVDFALFNNRLSGTIEYYNNKTSDILLQKPATQ